MKSYSKIVANVRKEHDMTQLGAVLNVNAVIDTLREVDLALPQPGAVAWYEADQADQIEAEVRHRVETAIPDVLAGLDELVDEYGVWEVLRGELYWEICECLDAGAPVDRVAEITGLGREKLEKIGLWHR